VATIPDVTVRAPLEPAVPESSVSVDWPFAIDTPAVTPILAALMAAARPAMELTVPPA